MRRSPLLAAALVAAVALVQKAPPADAGGGPETTLVVVNADSPTSWRIANDWVTRRQVPWSHVCALAGVPSLHVIDVQTFRDRILAPISKFLDEHGLADRIDLVAYSADFPYGVDFRADGESHDKRVPPIGALTGMTYLDRLVLRKAAADWQEGFANGYFRHFQGTSSTGETWGPRGFTCRGAWGKDEAPDVSAAPDCPDRHRLSVMLAYTGTWGNSVPEALGYLRSAIERDGTAPKGTVYLCKNADVRSTTREPMFAQAIEALEGLHRTAAVLEKDAAGQTGVLPVSKDDVMGAVVGSVGFSWGPTKSRLLPGSIAEHLTSFGGEFDTGSQTKCTEFLRFGAAGSSGVAAEPLSIWMKFPTPLIHAYYAAGCSLGESFYESVASPYQLLILGDALARPFAKFAKVEIEPLPATVAGKVGVVATATPAEGRPLGKAELWVDGLYVAEAAPGSPLPWDTTAVDDGTHEVRVVAVESDPVETRSFARATAVVRNGKREAPTIAVAGKGPFPLDATLSFSGRAVGAKEIEVFSGARLLATAKGDFWKASVPAAALGIGTVPVFARAVFADGPASRSAPLDVAVDVPAARKAVAPPAPPPPKAKPTGKGKTPPPPPVPVGAKPGLKATLVDGTGKSEEVTLSSLGGPGVEPPRKAFDAKGKGPWRKIAIDGQFEVKAAGAWQLDVTAVGEIEVQVDGKPWIEKRKVDGPRVLFGLANLDAGWHDLSIDWVPSGAPDLTVWLAGEQVAAPLVGASLRGPSK